MKKKTHLLQDFSKIKHDSGTYMSIKYDVDYVLLTNYVLSIKSKYYIFEDQFINRSDFDLLKSEYKQHVNKNGRYYVIRDKRYVPIEQRSCIQSKIRNIVFGLCQGISRKHEIYHYDEYNGTYYPRKRGLYLIGDRRYPKFYAYENWKGSGWFIKIWRNEVLKDLII